ncbi:MAG: hypothetical protein JWL73_3581 [Actinomycetia bacterium]|nr:hypothetical protein [Actinomycetes bacterium]
MSTAGPATTARLSRGYNAQTMLMRLLEVAGLICIPTVVSLLVIASPTRRVVSFFTYYRPVLLLSRPQTIFGSAFYLPNVEMVGLTTVLTVALFTPYVLARGTAWSARVFFTGHVIATLSVAAVVIPGDWAGWRTAIHIAHSGDLGASAGLAACAGGLAVLIGRRWWWLGGLLLAGLGGYFLQTLLQATRVMDRVAEVEHLIAMAVGVALELWWLPRHDGHLWIRHRQRGGVSARRS